MFDRVPYINKHIFVCLSSFDERTKSICVSRQRIVQLIFHATRSQIREREEECNRRHINPFHWIGFDLT